MSSRYGVRRQSYTSSLGGARVKCNTFLGTYYPKNYFLILCRCEVYILVLWAGLGASWFLTNVRLLQSLWRCYDFTMSKRNDTNGSTMRVGGSLLCCNVFFKIESRESQTTKLSASANRSTKWAIRDTDQK